MLVYFWLLRRLFASYRVRSFVAFVSLRCVRSVSFRTFVPACLLPASALLCCQSSVSASARASASASACRVAPRTNCCSSLTQCVCAPRTLPRRQSYRKTPRQCQCAPIETVRNCGLCSARPVLRPFLPSAKVTNLSRTHTHTHAHTHACASD